VEITSALKEERTPPKVKRQRAKKEVKEPSSEEE
jgi:hypothetical protein